MSSPRRAGALVAVCAAAGLAAAFLNTTRAAGGPLIDSGLAASPPSVQDPVIARSRYIAIDFDALPVPSRRQLLARERSFPLELFPDLSVPVVLDRLESNAAGVTWSGRADNVLLSSVTLAYGNGLLAGSVILPTGTYRIRPAPPDERRARSLPGRELHIVSQINVDALPREGDPVEVELAPADPRAEVGPMADTGEFVDLMVLYTTLAMNAEGGPAEIENLINLGVSETNASYVNSGVQQRLRVVHTQHVAYQEPREFLTSLTDMRTGAGEFAGVPALRNAHGADLVMLLVHPPSPDLCGIGYLLTSLSPAFAPFGYNVVDTQCVSPGYTFAHELGHNMGARHDWFVDSGTTPFSYAHGYVNPEPGQRWRTIMAYPDRCTSQGFGCVRLGLWANPDNRLNPFCAGRGFNCAQPFWFLPGVPMGVPAGTRANCRVGIAIESPTCDADDARTLNNTALTIANLRASVQPSARRR